MKKIEKIIVCSKNEFENEIIESIITRFITEFEIVPLDISCSNIISMNQNDGINECKNRINKALSKISDGDIYIAIEGVISKVNSKSFLYALTTIYERKTECYSYGFSAGCHSEREEYTESLLCAISLKRKIKKY